MATTTSTPPTLPTSPIVSAAGGPAPQAGVVQIDLGAETGQVVTGAEFGLATTMGPGWTYQPYADPAFQAVADQHPTDLLRHNWELNTLMDLMVPTRASASSPDFSRIDTFLNQQGALKGFFDNGTATQVVTLGLPSWLNISAPSDQALYAGLVKRIAQHFTDKGEPVHAFELVNEPDGHENITDLANLFNVTAQALKSVDPSNVLGGLSESYYRADDMATFYKIAGQNIGFVSWHQYVEGSTGSKSNQQIVTDAMGAGDQAQAARAQMRAAGIPDNVPLFLGEYNVDGGSYDDPANGNMTGAVAAAAATYGLIHSDTNATMGALWDVQNDSAYSVFGQQGSYKVDPVGVVLSDLTATMPGDLVRTAMPSNTPGLVGYATTEGGGFSVALIDTNLSQGYTVDLSKSGLPTTGLSRVEVSSANPQGAKTAITDLSHVSVAAGSVVIVTNEAPHGGTLFDGSGSAPAVTPSSTTPSPGTSGTGASPTSTAGAGTTSSAGTGGSGTGGANPSGSAAQGGGSATTTPLPAASASTSTGSGSNTNTSGAMAGGSGNPAPASPGGGTAPAPVGSGADTLVLGMSEDAYAGDAQFTLTVDGKAVGPAQTVTASHSQGQTEQFAFKGNWSGPHVVGITFTNDRYDGTPSTDRNLYINWATFDGAQVQGPAPMYGNGTVSFGVGTAAPASTVPAGTLSVTDSTGSSTTVPLIAAGSRTDSVAGGGTVSQVVANGADTLTTSGAVQSEAATLGGGTQQKLILVGARAATVTGGSGADTVSADGGSNQFIAGSGSLDVTGGPGADSFVLHKGAGSLTVEDFDAGKGDTLSLDQSLQGSLKQASDGHGGTLLSVDAGTGTVDLIGRATLDLSTIRFV